MKFDNELVIPPKEKRSPRDTQLNIRIPAFLKKTIKERANQLHIADNEWVINAFIKALNEPNDYL